MAQNLLEVCESLNGQMLLDWTRRYMTEVLSRDGAVIPPKTSEFALKIIIMTMGSYKYASTSDKVPISSINKSQLTCVNIILLLDSLLEGNHTNNHHELLGDLYKVLSMLLHPTREGLSYEIIYRKFKALTDWIQVKNSFSREEWRCKILSIFCFKFYDYIIGEKREMELNKHLGEVFSAETRKYIFYVNESPYLSKVLKIRLIDDNSKYTHYADVLRLAQGKSRPFATAKQLYLPIIAPSPNAAAIADFLSGFSLTAATATAAAPDLTATDIFVFLSGFSRMDDAAAAAATAAAPAATAAAAATATATATSAAAATAEQEDDYQFLSDLGLPPAIKPQDNPTETFFSNISIYNQAQNESGEPPAKRR